LTVDAIDIKTTTTIYFENEGYELRKRSHSPWNHSGSKIKNIDNISCIYISKTKICKKLIQIFPGPGNGIFK
jgi:hypothetical protein